MGDEHPGMPGVDGVGRGIVPGAPTATRPLRG